MRGHCKNVISLYNQLKIVGLLETWSNIELHSAMLFLHVKHVIPQSKGQKRCGTSKKEIGTVKTEQAECLTLERKTMICVAPVEIQHQLVEA